MSHHPPHIYLNNTWYIITVATLNHAPHLAEPRAKQYLRDHIQKRVAEFKISLRAWVILDNHYHLLLKTRDGMSLPTFFARLHGAVSLQLNRWANCYGRQVWRNYWDTLIRDEIGYWTRFNYIHNNPVKHGYVKDTASWMYSSYPYYLRTKGADWLQDCWQRYPVVDHLDGDDF